MLDTDIVSLYLHRRASHPRLFERLNTVPPEQIWISVITVMELVEGALKVIRKHEQTGKGTHAYQLLGSLIADLNRFQIAPYDDAVAAAYRALPPEAKRVGRRDCQIAATAKVRGWTVVTRNLRDFQRIGVGCEDWT